MSWRGLVVTSGWGLLELRPTRLSLEEIFLQLTTEEVDRGPANAPPPPVSTGRDARRVRHVAAKAAGSRPMRCE